jgi:hypothetical protein
MLSLCFHRHDAVPGSRDVFRIPYDGFLKRDQAPWKQELPLGHPGTALQIIERRRMADRPPGRSRFFFKQLD